MSKREIWLSQNEWGPIGSINDFVVCSSHFSKEDAKRAAKKCQKESGVKHRVRKKSK